MALLGNTLPTGVILVVLILIFGPISGTHFNPAVTLALTLRGELLWRDALAYMMVQVFGAVLGVWAEAVATFGLLLAIFGCLAAAPTATASTSRRPTGSRRRRRSPTQR